MPGGIANPYIHGAGGAAFLVEGVTFPNADSGVVRGAQLTGAADSKQLTFAIWVRVVTWTVSRPLAMSVAPGAAAGSAGAHTLVDLATVPLGFNVQGRGTSTSTVLGVRTTNTLATNTWYCLMGSFDLSDTAKRHLYIGDTNELTVLNWQNETMDFTVNDFSIALAPDLSSEADVELGPYWWGPAQYVDLSNTAIRRGFFSAAGKPVDAGAAGATPTGTAPLVYLRVLDGAAASTFSNNLGTGGAMTSPAALGIATTSPSD